MIGSEEGREWCSVNAIARSYLTEVFLCHIYAAN